MAKKTEIDLINLDPKDAPKETPSAKTEPEDSASKGKRISWMKKKKILVIGLAGLVLSGGSVVLGSRLGWIHVPGLSSPPKTESSSPSHARSLPSEKQKMGQVVKLSPLIANLKEEGGRNYLKTTIVLEVEKKAVAEEVQARMSILTDAAISILSDKRMEDLRRPEAKDSLKQELLAKLNQHLGERITRIYFDEFLYQ